MIPCNMFRHRVKIHGPISLYKRSYTSSKGNYKQILSINSSSIGDTCCKSLIIGSCGSEALYFCHGRDGLRLVVVFGVQKVFADRPLSRGALAESNEVHQAPSVLLESRSLEGVGVDCIRVDATPKRFTVGSARYWLGP